MCIVDLSECPQFDAVNVYWHVDPVCPRVLDRLAWRRYRLPSRSTCACCPAMGASSGLAQPRHEARCWGHFYEELSPLGRSDLSRICPFGHFVAGVYIASRFK